jgi:hypothetical protein
MICTDKKTQFSQDRVINCFIIAASYVSSRLIAGGSLVTNIRDMAYFDLTLLPLEREMKYHSGNGPLLNPALALG